MLWWGGAAGFLLVAGLAVVLALLGSGELGSGSGPFGSGAEPPPDVRPPLARLCPPPSATANPGPPAPEASPQPVPSGPRTIDAEAGISYRAYGEPWKPWPYLWEMGTLEVPYGVGQHIVTEVYQEGEYHASILSAAVPATVNDAFAVNIECVGRQVAADVRASYYPQPNTMELRREERTTLAGMPSWVTIFRLRFDEPGLRAKDELVALAVIDVGRPTAAVLFISIPGTHRQWDHVVDEVFASVRPV